MAKTLDPQDLEALKALRKFREEKPNHQMRSMYFCRKNKKQSYPPLQKLP